MYLYSNYTVGIYLLVSWNISGFIRHCLTSSFFLAAGILTLRLFTLVVLKEAPLSKDWRKKLTNTFACLASSLHIFFWWNPPLPLALLLLLVHSLPSHRLLHCLHLFNIVPPRCSFILSNMTYFHFLCASSAVLKLMKSSLFSQLIPYSLPLVLVLSCPSTEQLTSSSVLDLLSLCFS